MAVLQFEFNMRLALGIDENLEQFSVQQGARMYTQWDSNDWRALLPEIAGDADTEILWNLTDVDVERGLHRAVLDEAGVRVAGVTDWELLQFCRNAEWRERSRFFRGGIEAPDPFAAIGWCDHGDQ